MYILIKYIRSTKIKRRRFPFFIRHHISSLIKLLNESEYLLLLSWIDNESDFNFLEKTYKMTPYQSIDENDEQYQKKVLQIKQFQENTDNTIFKILNKSNIIILVEFRYISHLLNYYIDPSNHYLSSISLLNLEKIHYKKTSFKKISDKSIIHF